MKVTYLTNSSLRTCIRSTWLSIPCPFPTTVFISPFRLKSRGLSAITSSARVRYIWKGPEKTLSNVNQAAEMACPGASQLFPQQPLSLGPAQGREPGLAKDDGSSTGVEPTLSSSHTFILRTHVHTEVHSLTSLNPGICIIWLWRRAKGVQVPNTSMPWSGQHTLFLGKVSSSIKWGGGISCSLRSCNTGDLVIHRRYRMWVCNCNVCHLPQGKGQVGPYQIGHGVEV